MKNRRCKFQILIFACCLFFSFRFCDAQAKPHSIKNLTSPVSANSKLTYLDLIRLFLPDAEVDRMDSATATKTIPLRNVFGDYKDVSYQVEMQVSGVTAGWIRTNGRRQLLMTIDLDSGKADFTWGQLTLLAVIDLAKSAKLIDVVDINNDRFAFLAEEQPVIAVNRNTDAYLIANHHFGSGHGYINLDLISLVNNRLKVILGGIPTLENDVHCGTNYEEKAFLKLLSRPAKGYGPISVNVRHTRKADDKDCDTNAKALVRNHWYRFVWNRKRLAYVKG